MHRLSCLVVIGALAAVVSVVAAGPAAAAKGGNNDTAKLCQKGTWKALLPDAGGAFVNQGDCVNDGAQGSAPFGAAGKTACVDIGGSFELRTTPFLSWACQYASPPLLSHPPELQAACFIDTPQQGFETDKTQSDDLWIAICVPFGVAGKAICDDLGGQFHLRTDPLGWFCQYPAPPSPPPPGGFELQTACAIEAPLANFVSESAGPDPPFPNTWVGICEPPAVPPTPPT
jgi:hypothetical protein